MCSHIEAFSQRLKNLSAITVDHKGAVPEGVIQSIPQMHHHQQIFVFAINALATKGIFVVVVNRLRIGHGADGGGIPSVGVLAADKGEIAAGAVIGGQDKGIAGGIRAVCQRIVTRAERLPQQSWIRHQVTAVLQPTVKKALLSQKISC